MRAPKPSRTLAAAIALAAIAVLAYAPRAAAQQPAAPTGVCHLEFQGQPTGRVTSIKTASGGYNTFLGGGGWTARCPAQNIVLQADSLEYFDDTRVVHLFGHVHYTEPRLELTSELLTYWMSEERLRAEGSVDARFPSGSTLRGPLVDYYRAVPQLRPVARMVAPQRPTIELAAHDSTGAPAAPTLVVANTVVSEADSLVYASGQVDITRPDLVAHSDSAFMDSGTEFARLIGHPEIHGTGERPFTLTAVGVDLQSRQRVLEHVLASGTGRLVSEDLTMTGDTLSFTFADGKMERVFSWGPGGAHAFSPTYDLVSDSMDIVMPGQRLREVRAVTGAFARSVPDSVAVHTTERDWLRGDTIVATFDTLGNEAGAAGSGHDTTGTASADTARNRPVLTGLTAQGNARSFYHFAPSDRTATAPAINYVRGRVITITFAQRQVERVDVLDKSEGVYLDPRAPGDTVRTDSTVATPPGSARP
ncbi:MAG TPA: hypothetical protein VFK13_02865 [Gemmatimonadaceae bacterium]|nr:hypothetical protein [Gemmatimonadaceae bacterium]